MVHRGERPDTRIAIPKDERGARRECACDLRDHRTHRRARLQHRSIRFSAGGKSAHWTRWEPEYHLPDSNSDLWIRTDRGNSRLGHSRQHAIERVAKVYAGYLRTSQRNPERKREPQRE